MANIADLTLYIKTSDPQKLAEALVKSGHIEGDTSELLEDGEGECDLTLDRICTGYSIGSNVSIGHQNEDEIIVTGGVKWEGWFSSDDIAILKKLCEEAGIELKQVSCRWYDETFKNMGAQVWPLPDWIMKEEDDAYKDGFAYAYPDEDFEDSVNIPDDNEFTLNGMEVDVYEFAESSTERLLNALLTGENTFTEEMHGFFPHCILFDYATSDDDRSAENHFSWDWTQSDEDDE